MKVALDGTIRQGQAVDLRDAPLDAARIVAAIRDPDGPLVSCPPPGPVHSFVGHVQPGIHFSLRAALAAAARSRAIRSEYDDAIDEIDRRIEAIAVEQVDLASARRRAASAGADVAALRERVARLRGRLEARREAGQGSDKAEADLRDAIATLSEAETDRLAAEQALAAAERDARAARDARDRRLSLVDERDNLARQARSALANREYPRFRRALASLPIEGRAGDGPGEFDGGPVAAALAVARIARLRAPVVLADGPFSTPVVARAALHASVVLV